MGVLVEKSEDDAGQRNERVKGYVFVDEAECVVAAHLAPLHHRD